MICELIWNESTFLRLDIRTSHSMYDVCEYPTVIPFGLSPLPVLTIPPSRYCGQWGDWPDVL